MIYPSILRAHRQKLARTARTSFVLKLNLCAPVRANIFRYLPRKCCYQNRLRRCAHKFSNSWGVLLRTADATVEICKIADLQLKNANFSDDFSISACAVPLVINAASWSYREKRCEIQIHRINAPNGGERHHMDASKQPAGTPPAGPAKRRCRRCGCTDDDCRRCITRTGAPCHWVEKDLCSACVEKRDMQSGMRVYPSYPIIGQEHGQEGWRR